MKQEINIDPEFPDEVFDGVLKAVGEVIDNLPANVISSWGAFLTDAQREALSKVTLGTALLGANIALDYVKKQSNNITNPWIRLSDREPKEGDVIIVVLAVDGRYATVYFGEFHLSVLKRTNPDFKNLYWVPLPALPKK